MHDHEHELINDRVLLNDSINQYVMEVMVSLHYSRSVKIALEKTNNAPSFNNRLANALSLTAFQPEA